MEAPQKQVVVCVVSRVLDQYVLEQTTVSVQDVVGTGEHLPSAPELGPCVAILQPRLVTWEEVDTHVLQVILRQGHCNPFVLLSALWCGQVSVEIFNHQQRAPPGAAYSWPQQRPLRLMRRLGPSIASQYTIAYLPTPDGS